MDFLLDTHALLWWFAGDTRLSSRAARAIGDRQNRCCLSSVSLYEIAFKGTLGKLPGVNFGRLEAELTRQRILVSPVTRRIARIAGGLPLFHRDPFDRMIVATSISKNWPLVTADRTLSAYRIAIHW